MNSKPWFYQQLQRARIGIVVAWLGSLPLSSLACVGEVPDGEETSEEEAVGEVEQAWEDGMFQVEGGCSNAEIRSCVGYCQGTVHSCDKSPSPSSSYFCECDGGVWIWVLGGGQY
jgi:hypothetical protein